MGFIKGTLLIYSLVFLAVLGNYFRIVTGNNVLILFLLVLIPLMVMLAMFKEINSRYFPFLIHSISLSLLFHQSLSVNHIFGSDIFYEKSLIDSIIEYHHWDFTEYGNLNGMLSLTAFAPILHLVTGLNVEGTLRITFPLIFSFVPLFLYWMYNEVLNKKYAFLSTFLFMSFWTFFTEMLQLARQMVAELILVLIIFIIAFKKVNSRYKFLLIIFTFTLVSSHYGVSYLFLFIIVLTSIVNSCIFKKSASFVSYTYIYLFITLAFFWYAFFTSSSIFYSIVDIVNHMVLSIEDGFVSSNYQAQAAVGLIDTKSFSSLQLLKLFLQYLVQAFIVLGVLGSLIKKKQNESSYYLLSYCMFFLLIMSIVVPSMAGSFNMTRLFHFSLIALSPFFIFGFIYLSEFFKSGNEKKELYVKITAICILVPYFLSTSGVLYDIFDDDPVSIPLGIEKMKVLATGTSSESKEIAARFGDIPSETDIVSAQWIASHTQQRKVYSDYYGPRVLVGYTNIQKNEVRSIFYSIDQKVVNNYCYLRSFNIKYDILISESSNNRAVVNHISLNEYLKTKSICKNKIYSSEYNVIYSVN